MRIKENKKKYLYLEVMRIFACFFVIFNHTEKYGFFLFSQRPAGGIQFFVYLFLSIFCKFAVPLFFAISGALLLAREDEPLKILWKKRIGKMAAILIVFSFVYYLYDVYKGEQVFHLSDFFMKLYSDKWNFSYWYLYAYLGFLVTLPFLRALTKNLKDEYFYYLFVLAIVFSGILPCIHYYFWQNTALLNQSFNVKWLYSNAVLYPCLGYFLEHRLDLEEHKKSILVIWIVNVAAIMVSCYMTYYRVLITGECSESQSQTFHASFVMINCAAMYVAIKYVFSRIKLPVFAEKLIYSLGSCTFGIYLLHILVMKKWKLLYNLQDFFRNQWGLNQMLAVFLVCFCTMMIGYVMTLILKKIPFIGQLIS